MMLYHKMRARRHSPDLGGLLPGVAHIESLAGPAIFPMPHAHAHGYHFQWMPHHNLTMDWGSA